MQKAIRVVLYDGDAVAARQLDEARTFRRVHADGEWVVPIRDGIDKSRARTTAQELLHGVNFDAGRAIR